ncbi:MAG: hypothetical protein ACFNYM_06340, partial [Bacteroidota bacterium]
FRGIPIFFVDIHLTTKKIGIPLNTTTIRIRQTMPTTDMCLTTTTATPAKVLAAMGMRTTITTPMK